MHVSLIEIQNFRKLKSIRVDLTETKTLFVGANNSGKTSAMVALGHFLVDAKRFSTNDFTLSNWVAINRIGVDWEAPNSGMAGGPVPLRPDVFPSLDIWLHVEKNEVHYVRELLPVLTWSGGLLGVRLSYQPTDLEHLRGDYVRARVAAEETKMAAKGQDGVKNVALWPTSLHDFLDKKLRQYFSVQAYLLDPTARKKPVSGVAQPQALPANAEPLKMSPLGSLIRINEINAQRGFSDATGRSGGSDGQGEVRDRGEKRRLTDQLRAYYAKHLDPSEFPEPADIGALAAIEAAQAMFDARLRESFKDAIEEVQDLGYPGVTDPKLHIATRFRPTDGLNHPTAVQYEVISKVGAVMAEQLRLPEEYNGLGYQNLISMIFRLMAYRDDWMEVGKASKGRTSQEDPHAPLHLVLVEEPEAHLHAQVQQVFIRKAYDVLRKHPDLGDSKLLRTQLVVSTHSSHVAHECEFACLRYFRRLPAEKDGEVPVSTVLNCSEVFGPEDETKKFVTRYIRATHCDLFFADAAILVEGPAERLLVPHFIREHFKVLDHSYLTVLEIGGSHAHRLKDLIEHLGLVTLIVTDLDAMNSKGEAKPPKRGEQMVSRNETMKSWHPLGVSVDELANMGSDRKIKAYDALFAVRVAYQVPLKVSVPIDTDPAEVLCNTFEDALVFENLNVFIEYKGIGQIKGIKKRIEESKNPAELSQKLFDFLKEARKAELALDLLFEQDPKKLSVPTYITEGLAWLQDKMKMRQLELLPLSTGQTEKMV
jgi:predicted ATP-dependent endonuclease of OLD family